MKEAGLCRASSSPRTNSEAGIFLQNGPKLDQVQTLVSCTGQSLDVGRGSTLGKVTLAQSPEKGYSAARSLPAAERVSPSILKGGSEQRSTAHDANIPTSFCNRMLALIRINHLTETVFLFGSFVHS